MSENFELPSFALDVVEFGLRQKDGSVDSVFQVFRSELSSVILNDENGYGRDAVLFINDDGYPLFSQAFLFDLFDRHQSVGTEGSVVHLCL